MRNPSLLPATVFTSATALLLLAGCSIPLPQAEGDPTRFYVLSTSATAAAPAEGGRAIYLRPIDLASYLDTRPMIIRRGENEIEFREFARWGEPLDVGIGRVLREELLARGAGRVLAGPTLRAGGSGYDLELTVRVLACEGAAEGRVNFRAAWQLAAPGGKAGDGMRGDFHPGDLRWDGSSEASLAAAISRAVAGLATEIAAALKQ